MAYAPEDCVWITSFKSQVPGFYVVDDYDIVFVSLDDAPYPRRQHANARYSFLVPKRIVVEAVQKYGDGVRFKFYHNATWLCHSGAAIIYPDQSEYDRIDPLTRVLFEEPVATPI